MGKDIGGGVGYPIRLSKLEGISSRLGKRSLREGINISHKDVDDMTGRCITLYKESGMIHIL
jgi:hypothetical protein